ncbi:hypothetical protein [Halothermothrix orenii]|uniref:hypothetical protein n=1 Tax=Halothermothrix orenii TaxID=31909 RepID=UPI00030A9CD2|nr:hypothetical protein [Halothermothrix orenii]
MNDAIVEAKRGAAAPNPATKRSPGFSNQLDGKKSIIHEQVVLLLYYRSIN